LKTIQIKADKKLNIGPSLLKLVGFPVKKKNIIKYLKAMYNLIHRLVPVDYIIKNNPTK